MYNFYDVYQHLLLLYIKGLQCSFPMSLLFFICSMMGLLICKYEPFSVESLKLG